MSRSVLWTGIATAFLLLGLPHPAQAADDTARFFGTWTGTVSANGQTLTIVSVHDTNGYNNTARLPNGGTAPAGSGGFSAANGKYTATVACPNNSGTYHFTDNDTVVCTNAAGQTMTWRREKTGTGTDNTNPPAARALGYQSPTVRPGNEVTAPPPTPSSEQQSAPPPFKYDPSLPPETNAAIEAFNRRDYTAAWRQFMAGAQKGDPEAEAGVGAMLFRRINPPGTGFYAQSEKWLLASANQGNATGMGFLGLYYYDSARNMAGGINPGVNTAPMSPQLKQMTEARFRLARQWMEQAAAKNDFYAMGNLAILLDAGVGGPADPARAKQLRERIQAGPDKGYAHRVTQDTSNKSLSAAWQAGHYEDAIQAARASAAAGDANAQAMLGRAYYEGVGVPRDYGTAVVWLNKAVAQNNADAEFILGTMYERGRGVPINYTKAEDLFDKAAAQGQRFAQMEVKAMRYKTPATRGNGIFGESCAMNGGLYDGITCTKEGKTIDAISGNLPSGAEFSSSEPED